MAPLVSILVPVYNVEKYIERCARSIFEQTYTNLEFIFVDDCSTDSSIAILKKVIDDYPCHKGKTTIVRHPQNRGLAAARNTAFSSCYGDYVIHVDSDDWIESDAVESLVKRQQETDADIVYTIGYYKHSKDQQKIYCDGWSSDKDSVLTALLQDKATICMWSKLIRKGLYTDNGIVCDERGSFYEDFQVLSRLVYYSRTIACLDAFVYHYNRLNAGSLVSNLSNSIEIQRQGVWSIQTVCDFFQDKERNYYDLARQFYLNYLFKMLNANLRHRNKDGYKEILELLKATESKYWYLIGWDRLMKRMVDRSYYLKTFVSTIRSAMKKLWSQ